MSCATSMVFLKADHVSKQLVSVASGLPNVRYCNPGKSPELAPLIERRHK